MQKHLPSVLLALLVTFLWSTSWVLIKLGLRASLPALTFAGLRYSLAFLCLAPFVVFNPGHRSAIRGFSRSLWAQLTILGLMFYTLTQGAQFVALQFLPAATLTLLFNFSPVLVVLASGLFIHEAHTRTQWVGIFLSVFGAGFFFYRLDVPSVQILGLAAGLLCLFTNAGSSLLGRQVNARSGLSPLLVTTVSMGIGGVLLFGIGAFSQGFGPLDGRGLLIIAWLAVVNTAVAFTWYNATLRTLTAVESSVINNTMLPQIAVLAWLFLGESLNLRQIVGILLVGLGTLIVQLRMRSREKLA